MYSLIKSFQSFHSFLFFFLFFSDYSTSTSFQGFLRPEGDFKAFRWTHAAICVRVSVCVCVCAQAKKARDVCVLCCGETAKEGGERRDRALSWNNIQQKNLLHLLKRQVCQRFSFFSLFFFPFFLRSPFLPSSSLHIEKPNHSHYTRRPSASTELPITVCVCVCVQ